MYYCMYAWLHTPVMSGVDEHVHAPPLRQSQAICAVVRKKLVFVLCHRVLACVPQHDLSHPLALRQCGSMGEHRYTSFAAGDGAY